MVKPGPKKKRPAEIRNRLLRISTDDQIILGDGLRLLITKSGVPEHKKMYKELITRIEKAKINIDKRVT